ncbi:MAG: hypothetical protein U1F83_07840 [Verrucomicrobiota bacterium]
MSDIKFACPHCRQHIACDGGYASLDIECPSCGGAVVVPRLSGSDAVHPETVIVASAPSPKPPPIPLASTGGVWTTADWERHYDEVAGTGPGHSPSWLLAAFGTLIVAAVLRANQANLWLIMVILVIGAVIAGFLAARNKAEGDETGYQILKVLAYVGGAIVLLPLVALGILFLGCTVCR